MNTETVIVGGGLAGLSLALKLEKAGRSYRLLEARSRFGGRIHAVEAADENGNMRVYDAGPAWFWQGQPRIANLAKDLNLTVFEQYAQGELAYEDEQGGVHIGRGYASMAGSLRLDGAMKAMTDGIASRLPAEKLQLDARVSQIKQEKDHIAVSFKSGDTGTETITCQKVVLALPPRVAAHTIEFEPELPSQVSSSMAAIPTWMAAQAKIVAIYDKPFWREKGLSGDAMSRRGPMIEMHDASPIEGGPYALFGFVGVPARYRRDKEPELIHAAIQQLTRLFGEQAAKPITVELQDWAFEPETATASDHVALGGHPMYGLNNVLSNIWDNTLILGSTETARDFGGYLEGALEASDQVFAQL